MQTAVTSERVMVSSPYGEEKQGVRQVNAILFALSLDANVSSAFRLKTSLTSVHKKSPAPKSGLNLISMFKKGYALAGASGASPLATCCSDNQPATRPRLFNESK